MAQWIRRWSTKPEIPGSTPGRIDGRNFAVILSLPSPQRFPWVIIHYVFLLLMWAYTLKLWKQKRLFLPQIPSLLYTYGVSLACQLEKQLIYVARGQLYNFALLYFEENSHSNLCINFFIGWEVTKVGN